MKKVIAFTKVRYIMFILSIAVIAAGIAGTVLRGGFELGIDFEAGLNLRMQVAPKVLSVSYTGDSICDFDISGGAVKVILRSGGVEKSSYEYPFENHQTLGSIVRGLESIPGITVAVDPDFEGILNTTDSSRIIGLNFIETLDENPVPVNIVPADESEMFAPIDEIRTAVSGLDVDQIQIVGNEVNQEFIFRVKDPGDDKNFSSVMETKIVQALTGYFGDGTVLTKQSDYVGPRFSQDLAQQSIYLFSFALALILIYIWFRFKLEYAVSAIIALIHDMAVMAGFIGLTGMEVSTATIAAGLTIFGYSLNDTIVIFDRVRENMGIMRDQDFKTVIDTSISQSLSRTLMTSITTLLAVAAIYIFGAGIIRDFALALIVGIVVGTYSSIFVASPVLLGWTNRVYRKRKERDKQKYGGKVAQAPQTVSPSKEKTEEETEKPKLVPTAPAKKRYTSKKKKKKKKKK